MAGTAASGSPRSAAGVSGARSRWTVFQTGRPTVATTAADSWPEHCTTSGSSAATMAASSSGDASAVTATRRGVGPWRTARSRPARAAASRRVRNRGVPGTTFRPTASAPDRTAASRPRSSVMPQILTSGARAAAAASSGTAPAAASARTVASGFGARIRASPTSTASTPRARSSPTVAASRMPDSATTRSVGGHGPEEGQDPCGIHLQRAQVARVEPDDAGVRAERAVQLAPIVGLDERLETQVQRLPHEAPQACRRVQRGEQEDGVGTGRPQLRELPRVHHELLGQHGQGHGLAHGPQIIQRAAEVGAFAEHRDRRGAAPGVGARLGGDVQRRPGQRTGRGRGALDLGDDVEARRGQPLRERPGRRAPPWPRATSRPASDRRARPRRRRCGGRRSDRERPAGRPAVRVARAARTVPVGAMAVTAGPPRPRPWSRRAGLANGSGGRPRRPSRWYGRPAASRSRAWRRARPPAGRPRR